MSVALNIPEKELRDVYIRQKFTIRKCAEYFSCNATTIMNYLRKYNIPIRNLSEASKGRKVWNKGLKASQNETVAKLSRNLNVFKKGNTPWNKGLKGLYKASEKTKLKMSKSQKARMTKEIVREILRRRIPSSLEKQFQDIIDKHNLPYKYVGDGSFILGRFNPDFINTNSEKIAVEVYARYHKLRNKLSIDEWKVERTKVFRDFGWEIIYFDETEISEEKVLEVLGGK